MTLVPCANIRFPHKFTFKLNNLSQYVVSQERLLYQSTHSAIGRYFAIQKIPSSVE